MKKEAQVSIEYLTIFGFVFLMIVPLIIIFFDQLGYIQDSISENQIRNIVIKIIDKAESVYYSGEPSKTTLKVYFPDHIDSINISKNYMVFNYLTYNNLLRSIIYYSNINLTGNLSTSPGIHFIEIRAEGDFVSITEN